MSTVASGGFRFQKISVGGTWYWSIEANNIQGANQLYYLKDIRTPFGALTDGVDVPIPGDVVCEMASSLANFQQQLAPLLVLVSGQQTTFNVTITQGDPSSSVGSINFMNAGALGSFMTASATPAVPWLSASPTTIPGVGQNQRGQFGLILNPAILTTQTIPYTGIINIQDNRPIPTIIPITVNVTVLPPPIIDVSTTCIQLSWTLINGQNSGSQQLTVTNGGPINSILNFTVAKVTNSSPWLSFTPPVVTGLAGGSNAIITFSLNGTAIPQAAGIYFETILISSQNACSVAVQVQLTVYEQCGPHQAVEWVGGNYSGGPGAPYRYGPGNQIAPGLGGGDGDPPAPEESPWPRKS
jgi:hypothetical protein